MSPKAHPCDLHVLSMPPAFALSQDQTLRFIHDQYSSHQPQTNRPQTKKHQHTIKPTANIPPCPKAQKNIRRQHILSIKHTDTIVKRTNPKQQHTPAQHRDTTTTPQIE